MITRVSIKNYRSVEDLEFRPTRLCALVGENNAGKSNILRALKTVLGKEWLRVDDFSREDYTDHDTDRDIVIEVEFDPPLQYQGFAQEGPTPVPTLRFTLTRYKKTTNSANKGDPRLVQERLNVNRDVVQVLKEAPKKGQKHKVGPLTNIPRELKEQVPLIYIGTERRLPDQLPSAKYSLLRRLFEDVADAFAERKATVDGEERPLMDVFEEELNKALAVLRIDEFLELEEAVSHHALENMGYDPETDRDEFALRFGLFEPMDFFKAMRLTIDEGAFTVDALDTGHGAQNAIVVAIFQAYEKLKKHGAIFLIEEPELHLHPHRSRYFYETLRRVSETNQVIYSTHSPHFVTVPYFDEVRLVYRGDDRRTKMNEPRVPIDASVREKLIKELDPERNELFFARHVILVEGDTEKLAIPEYAKRLGIDLNRL